VADELIEQLLERTGLYVGTDHDPNRPERSPQVARINVAALPGRVGVAIDYEGIRVDPQQPIGHAEHAVLARSAHGVSLYSVSIHSPILIELRETTRGYFEPEEGASPYPVAIRLEIPAAGRLVYTWLFAEPGGDLHVANIGDVTLTTG